MEVRDPFAIPSAEFFRLQLKIQPPAFGSAEYNKDFIEVLQLGGDDSLKFANYKSGYFPIPDRQRTKTKRDTIQTFIGKFWAYDGSPYLCAPPRLYNMIATSIATGEKSNIFLDSKEPALDFARFLALVNIAMADAAIAAWEAKYYFLSPRPVTAIREYKNGNINIPSDYTARDLMLWAPLGGQNTNSDSNKVNFTPNFPSYPSGHSTFGGALFEIIRRFCDIKLNTAFSFKFVSDEYNGNNLDPETQQIREYKPREFKSIDEAEKENARSRIYLGIHFQFDADDGLKMGNKVGDYVFDHLFLKKTN